MSVDRISWHRIIAILIIGVWMIFSGTTGDLRQVVAQTRPDPKEAQDPQNPGVVKVDTVFVTVPTIITDRFGQFVTGLSRADFTVREDGQGQAISEFSSTESPFNVALLIDTSHSTQRKLSSIRKAALAFVKQLQTNDRVILVTFDDQVRFVSELTSDRAALERAIDSVKSNYATSLYDAIHLTVVEKLAPLTGRKAIVILTDGVDTASKRATFESALELVSNAGIITYTIQYETRNDGGPVMKPLNLPNSIGSLSAPPASVQTLRTSTEALLAALRPASYSAAAGSSLMRFNFAQQTAPPKRDRYLVAHDFLLSLAQQSGARYLRAETIESASYAFRLIAEELRHQYTLSYYSTNDQRDGRVRNIEVRVKYADLLVRARQAYRAPRAEDDQKPPPAPNQIKN